MSVIVQADCVARRYATKVDNTTRFDFSCSYIFTNTLSIFVSPIACDRLSEIFFIKTQKKLSNLLQCNKKVLYLHRNNNETITIMSQFEFTKEMIEDAIDCVYEYLANADSPCEEGIIKVEDEFTLKDGKIVWIDFDFWTEDYDYRPERYNERLGIWEQEECSGKYVAKINLISYYNDDDDNEYICEDKDLLKKEIEYEWY